MSEDIDELRQKAICHFCLGDAFLSDEVETGGMLRRCSYCGELAEAEDLDSMVNRVEKAFEEHFERTISEPDALQSALMSDRELDYTWMRQGQTVTEHLAETLGFPDDAASDIQEILADKYEVTGSDYIGEEAEFSSDAMYETKNATDREWRQRWEFMETSLKSHNRHCNRLLTGLLSEVFNGLETLTTASGASSIVVAGPDHEIKGFARARVFQSQPMLMKALENLEVELSPPPPEKASAGRMNAAGVSVFYGADLSDVAIAEVRPPVGSDVVVAQFKLLRPVRLLNLTAFAEIIEQGSVFDPTFEPRQARAAFLKTLGDHITRPVMPDTQSLDYLATQAVCDYLAGEPDLRLDGILFPAVQSAADGQNVVLFHAASRVQPSRLPAGSSVKANIAVDDEDDPHPYFTISVRIEPHSPEATPDPDGDPWLYPFDDDEADTDTRPVTLELDPDSLKVHRIGRIRIEAQAFGVNRYTLPIEPDDF